MQLSHDFNELLGSLLGREVRFLVVGGYAVAVHGHPRYTGDLDLWIDREPDNARRVLRALHDFGFGSLELAASDLLTEGRVVQLGYPPLRVDLLTSLSGVTFDECYPRRVEVDLDGRSVPFISRRDLERNKRAAGRHQDLADLEALGCGEG